MLGVVAVVAKLSLFSKETVTNEDMGGYLVPEEFRECIVKYTARDMEWVYRVPLPPLHVNCRCMVVCV